LPREHLPSLQQSLQSTQTQSLVVVLAGAVMQLEAQQVLSLTEHFPSAQQVLQSTQTQALVADVAGTQPQPEALQSPLNLVKQSSCLHTGS